MKSCSVAECPRKYDSRGYCKSHARQFRNGIALSPADELKRGPRTESTLAEYFNARVTKTPTCWLWSGTKITGGYGRVKIFGQTLLAHRVSWELHNGALSADHLIDHLCHNVACVNPSHLRATTHMKNMQNRRGASSHSASGIRGVHWDRRDKKWVAEVRHDGVRWRKRFDTVSEAEAAAIERRRVVHEGSTMND